MLDSLIKSPRSYIQINVINNMNNGATTITRTNKITTWKHLRSNKTGRGRPCWTTR